MVEHPDPPTGGPGGSRALTFPDANGQGSQGADRKRQHSSPCRPTKYPKEALSFLFCCLLSVICCQLFFPVTTAYYSAVKSEWDFFDISGGSLNFKLAQ